MRNALWAEWLIARLTDPGRAASVVGDLLETGARRGSPWFWLSVTRIVLSLVWRRMIAFGAAFYVGASWRVFAIMAFFRAGHPGPRLNSWDPWEYSFSAVWFGTILCMVTTYAVVRYGLRDKLAQLALGFCSLFTVAVFYLGMPVVTVVCIALALSFLLASARSARRSRALMALTAAFVLGLAGGLLAMYLRAVLEKLFYYRLSHSDLDRTAVNICFFLLAAWITTAACARMHDRQFRCD